MLRKLIAILCLVAALFASSCKVVKPHERVYLNDPEMQMHDGAGADFENYVQSIREGASSAGSSKGSGGCGCK